MSAPEEDTRPLLARPLLQAVVLLVFFVSGAAALVYEVVWTRSLTLVFGVTTYATATVLATYMGGLALGSWYFGRWIDRGRHPLRVYAGLELGIGLYALLVPVFFDAVQPAYVLLHQADLPAPVFALLRALMMGGVLLVPTTLMGGTFPVLVRFFVASRGQVGGATGLLYAFNTAGAVAGCVLAGFVLIAEFGLAVSIWVAVVANLACALSAVALAPFTRGAAMPVAEAGPAETGDASPRTIVFVLIAIGLSGFAALAYEVVWTRALLRYIHNSVYAFTTMLTTFLAGIAIGSALYTAFLRNLRRQLLLFAVLELSVGIGFLVSAHLFAYLPQITEALRGTAAIDSFGASLQSMVLMSGLILFVPSVLLGATVPAATHLSASRLSTIGSTVGRVYAVNTLGSILGSLGAGFLLIPVLGMQGTITLLVALNIVLGSLLLMTDLSLASRRAPIAVAAAAIVGLLVFALPSDLFRRTFSPKNHTLVFYQEGVTDTVGVVEQNGQRRIQYEDQRGTAGTTSYSWNFFLGHLPMLLHPGEPQNVLHICFGVGNSLSAVVRHDSVERVDNVELSPHILDAASYFWTNNAVISNPKVNTIIDDGRNHLMTTREVYDVIALEPPLLFTAGVIHLFTREFYEHAEKRLAPDGVLLQWLPIGEVSIDEERMIFRAMHDVFPHATAWGHHPGGPLLLIGMKQPLSIDYTRLRRRMRQGRVGHDLRMIEIRDVDHLLSYFFFDEAAFGAFASSVDPVTDDRTVVDFRSPYYLSSGFGLGARFEEAGVNGVTPLGAAWKRYLFYFRQRRSVVPYLTNLGRHTPEQVAARIERRAKPKVKVPEPIAQEEWQRP
jgi:spermidine synthase